MEVNELKERIVRAFKNVPTPEPPIINHECDECLELQQAFLGKSWEDISPELIRANFSKLPLLSAEAFHAFIPAYLLHSVENFDDDDMVSEFTAYAFLPETLAIDDEGHRNWWMLKLSLFSDEQFALLVEYLEFVERSDEYFDRALLARGRERLLRIRKLAKAE